MGNPMASLQTRFNFILLRFLIYTYWLPLTKGLLPERCPPGETGAERKRISFACAGDFRRACASAASGGGRARSSLL